MLALAENPPTLSLVKSPSPKGPTVEELTKQVQDLQAALRDTITVLTYAGISGLHLVRLPDDAP